MVFFVCMLLVIGVGSRFVWPTIKHKTVAKVCWITTCSLLLVLTLIVGKVLS